jgi:CBS domain containing-hemolysin-like protein
MALLIFFVALALGVSFMCSIMEAVLLSVSPSYVASLEEAGKKAGPRLRKLKSAIDRPLAAILSLNTMAHTVGAAGAGAQAAELFGSAWMGMASAVLTLLILVFSEIVPKTLGAAHWRRLASPVAFMLHPLIWSMYPLVKLSEGISYVMGRTESGVSISREEVAAMAELGASQGVLAEGESKILRNLFRLASLRVADIMTPRTVVYFLSEERTVGEVLDEQGDNPFSRIPLYGKNKDDVTGYVLKSDILLYGARDQMEVKLKTLRRELKAVDERSRLPELFDRLFGQRLLVALVVDEYGGTAGLVTMEDLVETLIGMEIVDEGDPVDDMRELARKQWEQRARKLGIGRLLKAAAQEEMASHRSDREDT